MTSRGKSIMQTYEQRCAAEADFSHPGYNVENLLWINKEIFTSIVDGFKDTIPADHLNVLLLECLRFAYPGVVKCAGAPGADITDDDHGDEDLYTYDYFHMFYSIYTDIIFLLTLALMWLKCSRMY